MLDTLTMLPPRGMVPNACLVKKKAPSRSTWSTRSQSSSVCSSSGLKVIRPALLTSTSQRPNRSTVPRTVAATSGSFDTSHVLAQTAAPPAPTCFAAASACAAETSAMTTVAPSVPRRTAVASPMPLPPPVTMATFPVNVMSVPQPPRRHWRAPSA